VEADVTAVPVLTRYVDDALPGVALLLRRAKHRLSGSVEMAAMRRYVRPGQLVVDVGARRGLFTAYLADLVGAEGMVEAFEPFPPNVAALRRLFSGRPQVRVHAVALSAAARTATLAVPLEGRHPDTALGSLEPCHGGRAAVTVEVACRRLDDLLARRDRPVRFVKCDVEGHELAVFRGATGILTADRPVVLAEIEQRHAAEPVATRFDFFASLGYTAWALERGRPPRPVDDGVPDGTGNMYLFLPGGRRTGARAR
jgi:FkbM family methyltransferase